MEMSHLYHDGSRGGPTIELDVREQMRTREVNAREERNFEKKSRSFEKAKDLCEKNTSWERWRVGQTLHTIWERTPRLEKSLAIEKARVEALQRAILTRSLRRPDYIGHQLVSRQDVVHSPQRKSAQKKKRRRDKARERMRRQRSEKPLNTDVGIQERHLQKQSDFVKRSEHVVKALARLNWRQETRRRDHIRFKEELEQFSKPVIDRARLVLKGRNDIDVDGMVEELQNYFSPHQINNNGSLAPRHGHKKTISGSTSTLASKSSHVQSTSSLAGEYKLTEGNLLKLDGEYVAVNEEESTPRQLQNSVPASSATDLTLSEQVRNTPDTMIGESQGKELDHNAKEKAICDVEGNSNGGLTKNDFTQPPDNIRSFSTEEVRSVSEENFHASNNDSKSFLPPILDGVNGISLVSRGSEGDNETKHNNVVKPRHSRSQSQPLHAGGVSPSDSASTPHSKDIFSPSTSISNVILEEDETEEQAELYSSSPRESHLQSSYSQPRQGGFGEGIGDGEGEEDVSRSSASYSLSSVIGLPRVWRQAIVTKKEESAPETTASAIARKHRRMRTKERT